MSRPLLLVCYRLSRELHIDIDEIQNWTLEKIYNWLAFFLTENEEWKKKYEQRYETQQEYDSKLAKAMGV